ncbi:MAG: EamA family transporter [Rhodospirillaceae bacterium]|jgi:drug/metabolite transporter (DMT)-like permease|nr:EamA family transporter [Rhodospirillaceae bacterium]MBT6534587.1 EamA family transporter [Rhodospirillaceae bacterium]MBT7361171.1 EamA family transporter [Rhodospirillaceae bacterium]
METTVFLIVLVAALLHATWNAVVKGGADKHLGMTAVVLGHIPISIVAILFVPLPDFASWPYFLAGMVLHIGYQLFLLNSYRIGDLTQVYPIARGTAPILVALVSVLVLGVTLTTSQLLPVFMIAIGIMSLTLVRQRDGLRNPRAAALAFVTGCFIAGYSLNDGLGAREAGTAVGFYAWLSLVNAVLFAAIMRVMKPGLLTRIPTEGLRAFLFGGPASFAAYALVVWAFTQAPIALVTALRETSIIAALLIGVFFLKERLDLAKVASTVITLTGAILLRFAR